MISMISNYLVDDDCELVSFGSLEDKVNAFNNSTKEEISNMHLTVKDREEIKSYIIEYNNKI